MRFASLPESKPEFRGGRIAILQSSSGKHSWSPSASWNLLTRPRWERSWVSRRLCWSAEAAQVRRCH